MTLTEYPNFSMSEEIGPFVQRHPEVTTEGSQQN
jgi:hypothetical protein